MRLQTGGHQRRQSPQSHLSLKLQSLPKGVDFEDFVLILSNFSSVSAHGGGEPNLMDLSVEETPSRS